MKIESQFNIGDYVKLKTSNCLAKITAFELCRDGLRIKIEEKDKNNRIIRINFVQEADIEKVDIVKPLSLSEVFSSENIIDTPYPAYLEWLTDDKEERFEVCAIVRSVNDYEPYYYAKVIRNKKVEFETLKMNSYNKTYRLWYKLPDRFSIQVSK